MLLWLGQARALCPKTEWAQQTKSFQQKNHCLRTDSQPPVCLILFYWPKTHPKFCCRSSITCQSLISNCTQSVIIFYFFQSFNGKQK